MSKKINSDTEVAFEAALQKLEGIVDTLEKGELPLEAALSSFAEGVSLSRLCLAKLSQAEEQINLILEEKQGRISVKPLQLEEEPSC
ncbi:MAG: exodeoxyribonuclease VII small subunit [Sporomusaceae bacterium]|nr:exodeoxyribonuclease VII small subunit [Sporomusaceae bacterium]